MSRNFNSRKPPRKKKDDGPRFFTSKDGTPMISSPAPPGPYNRRTLTPDYAAMNNPITRAGRQVRQLVDSISDAIEDTAKEAWKNTTEGLMFLSERDITRRLLRFQRNPIFGVTDVIADSINEIIELLATPKPPPPSPGAGGLYPPGAPFNKYPTRSLCDAYRAQGGALNVNTNQHFCWMQRRRYVDHRQQWEARAVALGSHPWYQYLGNEGANSFFSYWTWNRATEEWNARVGSASAPPANFWKNWTWGGPPPDTSDLTAGQYMITWMTWATYFLVNAIPQSKTWDGLAFSANREIPCELGDHKNASLPTLPGGATPGPDNPYGPEGCLRPEPEDAVVQEWFGGGLFYFVDFYFDGVFINDSLFPIWIAQYYIPFVEEVNGFTVSRRRWRYQSTENGEWFTGQETSSSVFEGVRSTFFNSLRVDIRKGPPVFQRMSWDKNSSSPTELLPEV